MNVLFTQIAALTGIFVFINQMWTYASVEKSVFLALVSGLAVYLVLVLGDFSIRAILDFKPHANAEQEKPARKSRPAADTEQESPAHPGA
ncbi:MAG TPA: hypothetical protein VF190_00580 [Rhodothermales bacterium]